MKPIKKLFGAKNTNVPQVEYLIIFYDREFGEATSFVKTYEFFPNSVQWSKIVHF